MTTNPVDQQVTEKAEDQEDHQTLLKLKNEEIRQLKQQLGLLNPNPIFEKDDSVKPTPVQGVSYWDKQKVVRSEILIDGRNKVLLNGKTHCLKCNLVLIKK